MTPGTSGDIEKGRGAHPQSGIIDATAPQTLPPMVEDVNAVDVHQKMKVADIAIGETDLTPLPPPGNKEGAPKGELKSSPKRRR